ncbi:MAG: hypothetical protein EBQ84_08930 [Betaproteobacteria bacterium]|jgi:hypothetical protein|nr:hypothetical protein [Betaproteobacteria bacterium]
MRAIKQAKKLIQNDPNSEFSKTLSKLILSLESDVEFQIKDLYQLSFEEFEFSMEIMYEWRIDRHYMGKAKVFDAALHAEILRMH